jgi:hypothetical protein
MGTVGQKTVSNLAARFVITPSKGLKKVTLKGVRITIQKVVSYPTRSTKIGRGLKTENITRKPKIKSWQRRDAK